MTVEVRPEPINERWEITELGLPKGYEPIKADAVDAARRLARERGTELIVYNTDHSVQERQRYEPHHGW